MIRLWLGLFNLLSAAKYYAKAQYAPGWHYDWSMMGIALVISIISTWLIAQGIRDVIEGR